MKKSKGFTLIELMIAVLIFAIITIISYRTISALITTKQVVTDAQNKWGGLAQAVTKLTMATRRALPLVVRDENGNIIPAVWGKDILNSNFDSQLEVTINGFIGDKIYGITPPKRVGFRFVNGNLYMVNWPTLNRVLNTRPEIDNLLSNVKIFTISFLYPDLKWRSTWPAAGNDPSALPKAIKIYLKMDTEEEINLQWAPS